MKVILPFRLARRMKYGVFAMRIEWRHDVEKVLKEASASKRPVLLDFSAAPM